MEDSMKFARILCASLKQSIIYEMQYRTNFFIDLLANLGWASLSFLTINIIGSNVSNISQNWTKAEYTLLWGIAFISDYSISCLFKRNIERIPEKIVKGDLDFIISKPFNSKILASLGYARLDMIFPLLGCLFITFKALLQIQNDLSAVLNVFLFFILLIPTSIVAYSMLIGFISLSFWLLGADNLVYIVSNINQFSRYPTTAFGGFFRLFLTIIIPISFMGTFPAEAIIHVSLTKVLLVIFVAIVTYKISDIIWNLGLRSYSSASS